MLSVINRRLYKIMSGSPSFLKLKVHRLLRSGDEGLGLSSLAETKFATKADKMDELTKKKGAYYQQLMNKILDLDLKKSDMQRFFCFRTTAGVCMNANIWSPIHLFCPGFMMHQGYQSDACEPNQLLTAIMTKYASSLEDDFSRFFCPLLSLIFEERFPNYNNYKNKMLFKHQIVNNFAMVDHGNILHQFALGNKRIMDYVFE